MSICRFKQFSISNLGGSAVTKIQMRKKSKAQRSVQGAAVGIALVLSVATNCYLILHMIHVDIQPTSPLLKIAMRRLRGPNRSIELVSPLPPADLIEPFSGNASSSLNTSHAAVRSPRSHRDNDTSRDAPDALPSPPSAAFLALLDDAVAFAGRMRALGRDADVKLRVAPLLPHGWLNMCASCTRIRP